MPKVNACRREVAEGERVFTSLPVMERVRWYWLASRATFGRKEWFAREAARTYLPASNHLTITVFSRMARTRADKTSLSNSNMAIIQLTMFLTV
jgi:hypothetical protein